ncbi:MAG TPA: ATP-NAD kinase family protein [Porticoccaceae bacterium]
MLKIGFVINPRAGLGGPLAFKGSDHLPEELAVGQRCAERAGRVLDLLFDRAGQLTFVTAPGPMGEAELAGRGFTHTVISGRGVERSSNSSSTTAADTVAAVEAFQQAGVDLILFAGGDGTARDVHSVIGRDQLVLGIPAGVKMHSGVFAVTPEAAAAVVLMLLDGRLVDLREQTVRDMDEEALARGEIRIRSYGEMKVPEAGGFVQRVKEAGREVEALVVEDIAAEVSELMEPGVLYLLGPGSTTRAIKAYLGMQPTLLGVDAIADGRQVGTDLDESAVRDLLEHYERAVIVLTPIGGQGILLGRGNQQFSPAVVRRVGRGGLWVVATKTKITALEGRPLLLDTNDPALDQSLAGYIQVITGYRDTILYPVTALE